MSKPNSCSQCKHEGEFPIKQNIHYNTKCNLLQTQDKENLMYCIKKTERTTKRREGCPYDMKISAEGLKLIKQFEGLRFEAYKPVSTEEYYTIGYGHYGADVTKGRKINQAQAHDLLMKDIEKFEIGVNHLVKVPVTQGQFDALVAFAFNCGLMNLKSSTLMKLVNERKFNLASLEFSKWNRAGGKVLEGLVRRRDAERQLFIGKVS